MAFCCFFTRLVFSVEQTTADGKRILVQHPPHQGWDCPLPPVADGWFTNTKNAFVIRCMGLARRLARDVLRNINGQSRLASVLPHGYGLGTESSIGKSYVCILEMYIVSYIGIVEH
jgi:hypothetical protein